MNIKQIKQYMLDCLVSGEHIDDAGEDRLAEGVGKPALFCGRKL